MDNNRRPLPPKMPVLIFLITLGLVGLSIFLLNSTDNQPVLRVAYHPDLHGAGIMVLADEKGYFKDEGLNVEMVKFLSGIPEIQAMAAGVIDIGYIGVGTHFYAAQNKCRILVMDSLNLGDELIAHRRSGINSLKDLQGKKIGVPKGTSGDMILSLALEKAGLKPDQVRMIDLDVAGAVAAFGAEKIDAVSLWVPYTSEIAKQVGKKNIVVLADNNSFSPEYVFLQSWVTTDRFLENHPDLALKFIRAWSRANDYRFRNMEEAVQLTSRFTQVPEDSLRVMVERTKWFDSATIKKMYQDGTLFKWYENQEQIFIKTGKLQKIIPAERFLAPEPFWTGLKYIK